MLITTQSIIVNRIKVSIVGSAGIPSRYGGFETLAEQLCLHLHNQLDFTVFCSSSFYSKDEQNKPLPGVRRRFLPLAPNGISSILYDFISMLMAIRTADILLVLGASGSILFPLLRILKPKTKIIFHPDGLEWKRKKWNRLVSFYLKTSVQVGCRFASTIIIDSKALMAQYQKYEGKIRLITYGGDQFNVKKIYNSTSNYWLTIARAEPENNLEIIASAFTKLKNMKWVLISNYRKTRYGRKLYEQFNSNKNIIFKEEEYNKETLASYLSHCTGYIHGHSAGGTNPSLVSALFTDKPLLCHNNEFNKTTTHNQVSYFNTESDIIQSIGSANSLTKQEMDFNFKNEYSWEQISRSYFETINNCMNTNTGVLEDK